MNRVLLFFLILNISPLYAETSGEAKVLKALCQYENVSLSSHINPYFLKKLPVKKLIGILNSFKKEEGACVNIEKIDQNNFLYTTEKSERAMQLYLDKNQKIRGLWFGNATKFSENLLVIADEFKKLSGISSVLLVKNNKTDLISYNSDIPLAVDSSSNILLLNLLAERVRKTKLDWTSIVRLKNDLVIPAGWNSGRLSLWPEKSPLTIQTLATMTMAYSDETAGNHIFSIIGRKKLENASPRNKPYLSSLEFFKLRGSLIEDFGKLKLEEKRKALEKVSKSKWVDLTVTEKPFQIKSIGWMMSTRELCRSMYELRNESFIKANPGLAQSAGWDKAGFIMGRAPGVLQYTQLLKPKGSKDYYCLSATWNDEDGELETSKVDSLIGRILSKIQ